MTQKRPLPPRLLLAAIVALIGLHFVFPIATVLSAPFNLLGLLPLAIGIYLNLSADALLKRYETTVKPFQQSEALVTSGVYGYSRHPMYLGFVLILLGLALLLGTAGTLVIVAISPIVLDRMYIQTEEAMMRDEFGDEWTAYESKVRKWL